VLNVQTHIQLKNILFATDFSPAACVAVPYAAMLARRHGAKLYAFHVRGPAINPMTPPGSWRGLEEAAEMESNQQKRALLNMFPGLQPEILINDGDLWSSLATAVKRHDIDLIVLGTHGRTGMGKFLLGSVAEEIFRQAPCPVLTVGPHAPAEVEQSSQFTHILLATDFSPESLAAASYAVSLAREYQAHLTLLHVVEETNAGELVSRSELAPPSERLLRNLVPPQAELRYVPDCVVQYGSAPEGILDVAAQRGADLIVLGVRQPHGFPAAASHLAIGTAHKVVSQAPCPVLTVRAL